MTVPPPPVGLVGKFLYQARTTTRREGDVALEIATHCQRSADNQPSEAAVVPSSPGFLVRFFPLLVPVYGRGKIRAGGVPMVRIIIIGRKVKEWI